MRLELTRSCDHYPLKVACIPISPPARSVQQIVLSDVATRHKAHDYLRSSKNNFSSSFSSITKNTFRELKSFFECYKDHFAVPRTGLEPARLATYAPETYASTNSATWAGAFGKSCYRMLLRNIKRTIASALRKTIVRTMLFRGVTKNTFNELSMNFVPLEKVSRTSVLLISLGERQTRLELATPTLARSCSTN